MIVSRAGAMMAASGGLRSIMEDIALSMADRSETPWLNLGIGNPAAIPEVAAAWREFLAGAVASSFDQAVSRYGPSRGTPELVAAIETYFRRRYNWDLGPRNIVVVPGSQMLCFMAAALFSGPAERCTARLVLPALPDYAGYHGLSLAPGVLTGVLPEIQLRGDRTFRYRLDFPAVERVSHIGLLLLSSPSNPAGRRADVDELARLARLAEERDIPLLIDNAYGAPFPGIGTDLLAPQWHRNIINCFSLSKAGLPGERIAFAIGDERYIDPLVSFLTNAALHAPQLAQVAVAEALDSGELDAIVSSAITPFYAERRRFAEAMLRAALPESVPWRLHDSHGGMFSWVWIDAAWFDDLTFYQLMKSIGVAIVPGRFFFSDLDGGGPLGLHARQCFRISLTAAAADIAAGIERIATALVQMQGGATRQAASLVAGT